MLSFTLKDDKRCYHVRNIFKIFKNTNRDCCFSRVCVCPCYTVGIFKNRQPNLVILQQPRINVSFIVIGLLCQHLLKLLVLQVVCLVLSHTTQEVHGNFQWKQQ